MQCIEPKGIIGNCPHEKNPPVLYMVKTKVSMKQCYMATTSCKEARQWIIFVGIIKFECSQVEYQDLEIYKAQEVIKLKRTS